MITYYDDIRKVRELELPWETLNEANILITGASGLIGRALVDALMQLPDKTFHLYAGHVTGIMRETVSYNTRIQILLP